MDETTLTKLNLIAENLKSAATTYNVSVENLIKIYSRISLDCWQIVDIVNFEDCVRGKESGNVVKLLDELITFILTMHNEATFMTEHLDAIKELSQLSSESRTLH